MIKANSKISIIIPVYNVEKYLEECLDSIINQIYENIEIICVNDCSTDNSEKILTSYAKKDNRIKVINQTKNEGAGIARNIALKIAKGEYIFYVDGDDYISSDCLQKLLKLEKETNADIVMGKNKIFLNKEGKNNNKNLVMFNSIKKWINIHFKLGALIKISENNIHQALFFVPSMCWNRLYKKDFLIKNDIYYVNENITHEDYNWHLKIMACLPLIAIYSDSNTLYYRLRTDSITYKAHLLKSEKKKIIKNINIALTDGIKYIKKHNYSKKILIESEKFVRARENPYVNLKHRLSFYIFYIIKFRFIIKPLEKLLKSRLKKTKKRK